MRGQTTGGTRAGVVAVLSVAGLMLVAVLAVWAASIGRDAVLSGEGPERVQVSTVPATPTAETTGPLPAGTDQPGEPPALLGVLAGLVVIAFWVLVAAVAFLVVRALWGQARLARRVTDPAPVDFDVLDQPARVSEQMERDASIQRALLDEGTPRTAIEACWHRFEVQAREAGLPREPWETSSEFTYRMLDLVGADPHAVLTLGELYREARFSEHPLGEDARTAARAALQDIQLSPRTTRADREPS
ncbi:DUF4129 domain-containing protein [Nocardioides sp. LHG3406-4]|uniref:DUF4129 domain-containing protein n=1 Tax=Nocardioides sp. LHG3406-4 TaxID=2804575 RepID=UPI003CE8A544